MLIFKTGRLKQNEGTENISECLNSGYVNHVRMKKKKSVSNLHLDRTAFSAQIRPPPYTPPHNPPPPSPSPPSLTIVQKSTHFFLRMECNTHAGESTCCSHISYTSLISHIMYCQFHHFTRTVTNRAFRVSTPRLLLFFPPSSLTHTAGLCINIPRPLNAQLVLIPTHIL